MSLPTSHEGKLPKKQEGDKISQPSDHPARATDQQVDKAWSVADDKFAFNTGIQKKSTVSSGAQEFKPSG